MKILKIKIFKSLLNYISFINLNTKTFYDLLRINLHNETLAGNFILDGSGTIQLDSAGNLITLTSTKVHQQSPYTLGGVDGYMHRIDGIGQMFNLGDADFIANYSIHTNHDNITSTCDTSFADTNGAGWEAGA